MKRDQNFIDNYSLVIALAIFALALFVLALKMSNFTKDVFSADSEEYMASVAERLRPFGQVYMPGDSLQPMVAQAETPEPVATVLSGPQVFNEACIACHGNGIGGAPMLTDGDNWAARIAQGTDVLYQHAIQGFTGSAGYMPPKGARLDLSDEEIHGAVDYMLSEIQ